MDQERQQEASRVARRKKSIRIVHFFLPFLNVRFALSCAEYQIAQGPLMKTPITLASPFQGNVIDRVVPLPEASVITGLSVDTLKRCHKREEIKIIRLSPRRIGIRLSDLMTFISERAA